MKEPTDRQTYILKRQMFIFYGGKLFFGGGVLAISPQCALIVACIQATQLNDIAKNQKKTEDQN